MRLLSCALQMRSVQSSGDSRRAFYAGLVLDLSCNDVEELASALADQTDYDHQWPIDPETGQLAFWTVDTGVDGQTPVDLDDLGLVGIDPLPTYVWYQDMADFAEGITDERAGRMLLRALQGKGAFRRFRPDFYQGCGFSGCAAV